MKCWKYIYKTCFHSIKDNFLIWFQYKCINRIISTNLYLYKIKQSETNVCRLCHEAEESLMHLFVFCPKTLDFWNHLESWLKDKLNITITFNPARIIFGAIDVITFDKSINVICITGKYFIFKCARLSRNLNFQDYKKYLETVYTEQLMLARLEMYTDKFLKNWSVLTRILNSN